MTDPGRVDHHAHAVQEALAAADAGTAGHWPTVAGFLADEVRRLQAEGQTDTAEDAPVDEVWATELPIGSMVLDRDGEVDDYNVDDYKTAMAAAMQALTRVCVERDDARTELDGRNDALALEVQRHVETERKVIVLEEQLVAVAAIADKHDPVYCCCGWACPGNDLRAILSGNPVALADVRVKTIRYAAMLAPETTEGANQWAWLRDNAEAIVEHMRNPGQPWPLPTPAAPDHG